ncbi:MAG: pilus assembly protein PilM [Clostridia bacterium]|nr:pilus assembly protein PilM [Clostridia bacterium]
MAKTVLGIDIGHDELKLALVRGGRVVKVATATMPENLLREGRITSRESLGELLRATMKENGIRANHAAFVIPNETVFIKNVEMPWMTVDQLEYNLPFEFNDYITGELKDYVFDYAVLNSPDDGAAQAGEDGEAAGEADGESGSGIMELMAVGTLKAVLEDAQEVLRKAGLRLVMSAPGLCAYINLLRRQKDDLTQVADEFGILDLGYSSIRMFMFREDRHIATRVLEVGLSTLDDVLADAYGVDVHLAHTYLMTNYENCQQREECAAAYENIAVELMRALNFYRFSNPGTALSDLWLCGGGAVIEPLAETIGDMLNIQLHPAAELVPGGDMVEDCNTYVQAIGIAMG